MKPTEFAPARLLEALTRHGVRFVLIGGLAGAARGAPWPTYDADVLIDDEDTNLRRAVLALQELGAVYDTLHNPPIPVSLVLVRTATGPQLFRTRHGRLDVLKEAGGETYASVDADVVEVDLSEDEQGGLRVRCASVPALIRMKRAANRPKDVAAVALLEAVLLESR